MDFSVKRLVPSKYRGACIIAGVYADRKLSDAAMDLDAVSNGRITRVVKSGDLDGMLGQSVVLRSVEGVAADRVILVGCGSQDKLNDRNFFRICKVAINALNNTGAKDVISYLTEVEIDGRDQAWKASQTARLVREGMYRFDRLKSKKPNKPPALKKLLIGVIEQNKLASMTRAVAEGQSIANGVDLAKDIANLPGNYCTPSYLARQAKSLEKKHPTLKVKTLGQKEMEKLGMGALLSVARGSRQAPKLVTMEYRGGETNRKPTVLVGKGITFDSGGISIKPAAAMDEMKFDMCGAACVLGAVSAVAELELPINLVGLIPSCENMPDGDANKPGDIVTSLSGQTIEVLNTDAEGRLILCDALTYADRYKPEVVIDIATLTGACVIALGKHASGLLSNDEPLADDLLAAGQRSGDRAWCLPLWEDYQQQLDSNFADMGNIGGREAGTITAACFLSRFAKKYRWAHLDIAGTAWHSGKQKGATGRPVPLLVDYLINRG